MDGGLEAKINEGGKQHIFHVVSRPIFLLRFLSAFACAYRAPSRVGVILSRPLVVGITAA